MSYQIQQQIKNNAADIRGYISDLYDWEENIGKKSQTKTKNEDQVLSYIYEKLPAVRGEVEIQSKKVKQLRPTQTLQRDQNNVQDYYKAWEKYDIDADLESLENDDVFKPEEMYKKPLHVATSGITVVKGGRQQSSLSPQLIAFKEAGNDQYKLGEYQKAISSYEEAIQIITKKTSITSEERELFVVLNSNQAQCYIHIVDYNEAERKCSTALSCDPNHVKSLQRRGTARKQLGKLKLALVDFSLAAQLDVSFTKEVKQIEQALKLQKQSARAKLLISQYEIDNMRNLKPIKIQDNFNKEQKQSETQTTQDVKQFEENLDRKISFGGVTFQKAEVKEVQTILKSSLKGELKYKPSADIQAKKSKDAIKRSQDCYDYKGLKDELIDGKFIESDEAHKQLMRSVEESEEQSVNE